VTSHDGHLFVYGHTVTAVFYDIQPSGGMAHRKVYEELIMLMNYNPPPVHVAQDPQVTFCYPNMFYDRHLDPRLSLKYVKLASSLPSDIAKLVHDELKVLEIKDQSLPPTRSKNKDGYRFSTKERRENENLRTTISDVRSIVGFYHRVSYFYCASIASTIALYPHADTWLSILTCDGSGRELDQHPFMIDDYILRICHDHRTGEVKVFDSIWSCLDEELRDDIRRVSSQFGSLAAFQFLTPLPEVEEMFKSMDTVARRNEIPSLACPVLGYITQNGVPLSPTPDSVMTLKSIPLVAKSCRVAQDLRRSARLDSLKEQPSRKNPSRSHAMDKPWPTVTVKRSIARRDPALFVQRVCDKGYESSSVE
jgi:hypothetical protein